MRAKAAAAGILLVAALAPRLHAQQLRDILRDYAVPAPPGGPGDLDRRIIGYAVENAPDLFVIAYDVPATDRSGLADTLRVSSYDRAARVWKHAALERRRTTEPAWDVGTVLAVHHTARSIYLDTHTNPSAGTIIVLTRALAPVAALDGWLLRILPSGVALYHRSEVHFAATHSAELWTFDARSRRDVRIYPGQPYGAVRRRYIDTVRTIYARLGEDWFRSHNHSMDPEQFDSSLRDTLLVNGTGTVAAFVMRFGEDKGTAADTPILDVVVTCRGIGQETSRCTETELAAVTRRHPNWTMVQILADLVGNPPPVPTPP